MVSDNHLSEFYPWIFISVLSDMYQVRIGNSRSIFGDEVADCIIGEVRGVGQVFQNWISGMMNKSFVSRSIWGFLTLSAESWWGFWFFIDVNATYDYQFINFLDLLKIIWYPIIIFLISILRIFNSVLSGMCQVRIGNSRSNFGEEVTDCSIGEVRG